MRLAVLALLVPGAAHAERFSTSGVEAGGGGMVTVWRGDTDGGAVLRGIVAGNLGALRVAGEYDHIDFATDGREGTLHRFSATLRFTAPTWVTHELATGWYAEAGVGRQIARWDLGGSSARTDVSLGVGWRFTGDLHHHRRVGYAWGLHVMRAPAFASGVAAHGPLAVPRDDLAISLATEVTLY